MSKENERILKHMHRWKQPSKELLEKIKKAMEVKRNGKKE